MSLKKIYKCAPPWFSLQMPSTMSWLCKHCDWSCRGRRFKSQFTTLSLIPGELRPLHCLFVFYSVWSVNIGTPSLQVHAVINRIQTLCVIAGKPSLSQCIRPMWSCSRASSCSTLRTSETCFRWSSLLIQIQTHGFRAEVCSASLTSTTMSVTLVKMFTAQPVNDKCEYHLIHKKPMRTTVLDGQYEMLGANYLQILWLGFNVICYVVFFLGNSSERHQWAWQGAGAGAGSVHHICKTSLWGVLFTSKSSEKAT